MSPLDLLLSFGLVIVDAPMLDAMKLPAEYLGPGAMELVFSVGTPKAEVGGTIEITGIDMEARLTAILGERVDPAGFGKAWLLGFEDNPRAGFIITAKTYNRGGRLLSVVNLEEWSAAAFRFWTKEEATPLTTAVATWIEDQAR